MIRLVVNADDLGLHAKIDDGIFEGHQDGIITSATLLCTGPSAEAAARRALASSLPLGLHLCLTSNLPPAAPPEEVPSLAPNGRFPRRWTAVLRAFALGKLRLPEVEREFRAQLGRARSLGVDVDHLDGHQHLHLLPGVATIVSLLAQEEGLHVRWPFELPRPSWLWRPGAAVKTTLLSALALAWPRDAKRIQGFGTFEAGALDEAGLLRIIERLDDGDYELGCHPGHDPGEVAEEPGWRYGWETELSALKSSGIRRRIGERGIQLVSYRDLGSSDYARASLA